MAMRPYKPPMRERILGRLKAYPVLTRSWLIVGTNHKMEDIDSALAALMAEGLVRSTTAISNGVVCTLYYLASEEPFILSYHERQGNRSLVPA